MLLEKNIFTGDYGFEIYITTGVNFSELENFTLKLRIVSPKGTKIDKSLTMDNIKEPKYLGVVGYVVEKGDFSSPGVYKLQTFSETDSVKIASDILQVRVRKSLEYKTPEIIKL